MQNWFLIWFSESAIANVCLRKLRKIIIVIELSTHAREDLGEPRLRHAGTQLRNLRNLHRELDYNSTGDRRIRKALYSPDRKTNDEDIKYIKLIFISIHTYYFLTIFKMQNFNFAWFRFLLKNTNKKNGFKTPNFLLCSKILFNIDLH